MSGWVSEWPDPERVAAEAGSFMGNPPHLVRPVKVKAVGPRRFRVGGEVVPLDAVIELPWHLAKDLEALGKVEFCEPSEADTSK